MFAVNCVSNVKAKERSATVITKYVFSLTASFSLSHFSVFLCVPAWPFVYQAGAKIFSFTLIQNI